MFDVICDSEPNRVNCKLLDIGLAPLHVFVDKIHSTCNNQKIHYLEYYYMNEIQTFEDWKNLGDKKLKEIVFDILEHKYAKNLGKPELNEKEKREAHSQVKTLHSFRHTYALKTWMETNDIFLVKKLLGL